MQSILYTDVLQQLSVFYLECFYAMTDKDSANDDCTCLVENSCVWCCKESANSSCQPKNKISASYPLLNLPDGYPCKQGYCKEVIHCCYLTNFILHLSCMISVSGYH